MNKRIRFVGFVCALFLLSLESVVATAEQVPSEARQWLDKMSQSARDLSYEGVFVYLRANRLTTMKVVHVSEESGLYEWLISLDGVPREVLRSSNGFTGIFQAKGAANADKSGGMLIRPSPLKIVENIEAVKDFYSMSMGPSDRTTGFASQVVTIHPQDSYRYGYRVWLDKMTGLLLKSDVIDEEGTPIEQVMFTSMTVFEEMPEALQKKIDAIKAHSNAKEGQPIAEGANKRWQVTQKPKGFVLEEYYRHPFVKNRPAVEHMVFSDGLASVSVFVEAPRKTGGVFEGIAAMGAVNAYGVVVNGQQVTVVGEVPQVTVRLIGDSVSYIE